MNPISSLKEKNTVEFINYLKRNSACDVIIFDAGGSCCIAIRAITELSDAIVYIESGSNAGLKYISYLAGKDFMSNRQTDGGSCRRHVFKRSRSAYVAYGAELFNKLPAVERVEQIDIARCSV